MKFITLTSVFFVFCFLLLVFLSTKGVVYSDEGYILYGASRILAGQLPFKDFHFVYTPLSLYATAFAFFIFGKSILAGRILMIILSMITSVILYIFSGYVTQNIWIRFLVVILYIAWGPAHTPFPWPVMFAISFSIFSLFFLCKGEKEKKLSYLVWSGVFCALVFLSKQNFGIAIGISYLTFIPFASFAKKRREFGAFLSGFFIAGGIYLLFLGVSGSLTAFINDLYIYTILRIIVEQTLTTHFPLEHSFTGLLKSLFYLFPLLISLITAIVLYKKVKKSLFLPVFVASFYLLGIRPTTDYIHLAPLLAVSGLLFPLLYAYTSGIHKTISVFGCIVFICIGFYTAYFSGFYKWEPPFSKDIYFSTTPKTYVYLDDFHKAEIEQLQKTIVAKTTREQPLYVYAYLPMLYFVTERDNPTPYDLIEPTQFYSNSENEIISLLKKSNNPVVITNNKPGKTALGNYLQKEYNITAKVNAFLVWQKHK